MPDIAYAMLQASLSIIAFVAVCAISLAYPVPTIASLIFAYVTFLFYIS